MQLPRELKATQLLTRRIYGQELAIIIVVRKVVLKTQSLTAGYP